MHRDVEFESRYRTSITIPGVPGSVSAWRRHQINCGRRELESDYSILEYPRAFITVMLMFIFACSDDISGVTGADMCDRSTGHCLAYSNDRTTLIVACHY